MPDTRLLNQQSSGRDFPYYRRLWTRVVLTLGTAAFLPLAILGGGLYLYLSGSIKAWTLENLRTEAVFHARTIDEFWDGRIRDLKLISQNNTLQELTAPGRIEQILISLQQGLPYFQDLGVIGPKGNHLAYAGPYDLTEKNYRDAAWFNAVMKKTGTGQAVYISDVFKGFRNTPHVIIAVRVGQANTGWILRATIVPDMLDTIVTKDFGQRLGDAYLINQSGQYQTRPRSGRDRMEASAICSPVAFKGVQLKEDGGVVQLTTWLKTVPWLSVVTMETRDIFSGLRTVRYTCIFAAILSGFLIILVILLTTDHLVSMLESKEKNINVLDRQLRQATHMVSSMELSKGIQSDLNDILSNIHITSALVCEDSSGKNKTLCGQIMFEADRGHRLITRFDGFVKEQAPVIMDLDVNRILKKILGFFSSRLIEKRIYLNIDYEKNLPLVTSDGNALTQVFQNVLANAARVLNSNAAIAVATLSLDRAVMVSIADNGPGLKENDLAQLFQPDHRTARGDLGLALAVSRSVMERMGGNIFARNLPDTGVIIQILIPLTLSGTMAGLGRTSTGRTSTGRTGQKSIPCP